MKGAGRHTTIGHALSIIPLNTGHQEHRGIKYYSSRRDRDYCSAQYMQTKQYL
jgi:hypothetical protein